MIKTVGAFVLGIALASVIAMFIVKRNLPHPAPAPQSAQLTQAAAVPAAQPEPTAPPPAEEPAVTQPPEPTRQPSAVRRTRVRKEPTEIAQNQAPEPGPAPVAEPAPSNPSPPSPSAPSMAPPAPAPEPPPAPQPPTVTIPANTILNVRLSEGLSTNRNQPGDTFMATLDQPLIIDGYVIAERGSRLEGRVVEAERAGRVKGLSHLAIQITRLNTSDGQRINIPTQTISREGPSSTKEDVEKAGAVAAIGAVIGAIAGGGKGAAIGAGVGGAAGAGGAVATRGKPVALPVETRLSFRTSQPVTITERLR